MKKRWMAGLLVLSMMVADLAMPVSASVGETVSGAEETVMVSESAESMALSESETVLETLEIEQEVIQESDSKIEAPVLAGELQNLGFILSWEKIDGISEYEVERKAGTDDEWELLARISDNYYTDSSLESGKKYTYRVCAVSGDEKSPYSNEYTEIAQIGPEDIQGVKAVAGECESVLSWNAVKNAEEYIVYQYDPATNERTRIGSTKEQKYKVTDLVPDQEYYYQIRARRSVDGKDVYSSFTDFEDAKVLPYILSPEQAEDVKVVPGECEVTLTWNKGVNAQGYTVRMYNYDTNSYEWVGSTQKCSLKLTDLKPGKYSFQIRSYRKIYNQHKYSLMTAPEEAVIELLQPQKAQNVKVVAGECAVTLTWDPGENAQGYTVRMYNYDTNSYEWVGSTQKCSLKLTDLKPGKYSFQIRSYRKIYNQHKYSAMTEAREAEVYLLQPGEAENIKVTSGECSATLQWDKGENAQGYTIRMYNSETKSYEWLGSTKDCKYTIKNLKPGTYSFQIRSYRKIYNQHKYSTMTKAVEAKSYLLQPEQAKNVKATAGGYSVTLKWDKGKNAQGYSILVYDYETNKYEWAGSTTGTSFTIKDLKAKQKYGFQVRSYRKVYDYHKYSAMTKTVDATPLAVVEGWNTINGQKYYYKDGAFLKSCHKIDGKYYYFDKKTGAMKTGWVYYAGYKFYFDKKTGARVNDVSSIIGKQKSYEIQVNKKKNVVTIYAKDGDRGYIIPVKAMICSTGEATPTGTFYTPNRWRWLRMMGDTWGQWVTQIKGDYLFHSVYYWSQNNNDLSVGAYNNLGKTCSHGCIRLTAADAKWIYDNCKLSTKVIINESVGTPFGKPTAYKLEKWHTWDPTDPNMAYKCKQRGCH